jgi:hypothetical protein
MLFVEYNDVPFYFQPVPFSSFKIGMFLFLFCFFCFFGCILGLGFSVNVLIVSVFFFVVGDVSI